MFRPQFQKLPLAWLDAAPQLNLDAVLEMVTHGRKLAMQMPVARSYYFFTFYVCLKIAIVIWLSTTCALILHHSTACCDLEMLFLLSLLAICLMISLTGAAKCSIPFSVPFMCQHSMTPRFHEHGLLLYPPAGICSEMGLFHSKLQTTENFQAY